MPITSLEQLKELTTIEVILEGKTEGIEISYYASAVTPRTINLFTALNGEGEAEGESMKKAIPVLKAVIVSWSLDLEVNEESLNDLPIPYLSKMLSMMFDNSAPKVVSEGTSEGSSPTKSRRRKT